MLETYQGQPGALTIRYKVFTEPGRGFSSGYDVLQPMRYQESQPKRDQIAARKSQEAAAALDQAIGHLGGASAGVTIDPRGVTIDANLKLAHDEAPLTAYLKELVRQTGQTILAYWPKDAPEMRQRLPGR